MAANNRAHLYIKNKKDDQSTYVSTYHFDVSADPPLPFTLPQTLVIEEPATTYVRTTVPTTNITPVRLRHITTTSKEDERLRTWFEFAVRPGNPLKSRTGVVHLDTGTLFILPPPTINDIMPGMPIEAVFRPNNPLAFTAAGVASVPSTHTHTHI